jgi:hypothetical protein
VSQSFGYIPKSGIAGSNGRSMFPTKNTYLEAFVLDFTFGEAEII